MLDSDKKLKILNFFDFSIQNGITTDILVLNNLISAFKELSFAKKHSRNLLKAFKLDATKKRYRNWSELIYYCRYSANPVGRFFIDLSYQKSKKKLINKEKIFKSIDNLCTCLQIINHLQDCKEDFKKLDRVYIPVSLFQKYSIEIKNLDNTKSSERFIKLKNEMVRKTEKLLNNSKTGLKLIDIWKRKKHLLF